MVYLQCFNLCLAFCLLLCTLYHQCICFLYKKFTFLVFVHNEKCTFYEDNARGRKCSTYFKEMAGFLHYKMMQIGHLILFIKRFLGQLFRKRYLIRFFYFLSKKLYPFLSFGKRHCTPTHHSLSLG